MKSRHLGGMLVVIGMLGLPACTSFQAVDMSASSNSLDGIKEGSTIRVTRKQGNKAEFIVRNKDRNMIYGDKEMVKLDNIQRVEIREANNKRTTMLSGLVVGVLFNPVVGLGLMLLSYMFIPP